MSTHPFRIIKPEAGGVGLKTRKLELGTKNLVGARVTQARLARGMKQIELLAQLQLSGVDLSVPALSLLEGQKRPVTDKELCALADALHVSVDWLLGRDKSELCVCQLPVFVSRRPHCADGRDFFDFCGGQAAKILHFL